MFWCNTAVSLPLPFRFLFCPVSLILSPPLDSLACVFISRARRDAGRSAAGVSDEAPCRYPHPAAWLRLEDTWSGSWFDGACKLSKQCVGSLPSFEGARYEEMLVGYDGVCNEFVCDICQYTSRFGVSVQHLKLRRQHRAAGEVTRRSIITSDRASIVGRSVHSIERCVDISVWEVS